MLVTALVSAIFLPSRDASGSLILNASVRVQGTEAFLEILPALPGTNFGIGDRDDLFIRFANTDGLLLTGPYEALGNISLHGFNLASPVGQLFAADYLGNPLHAPATAGFLSPDDQTLIFATEIAGPPTDIVEGFLISGVVGFEDILGFSSAAGAISIRSVNPITIIQTSSEEDPILPTCDCLDGPFQFSETRGTGGWFDPIAANGFLYETDGTSKFTRVGLPVNVPDGDGLYTVLDPELGEVVVAAGEFYNFTSPVDSFTIMGIDPSIDGEDAQAFPTFLEFDQLTVNFTMSPITIPEPTTASLALFALTGLCFRRNPNNLFTACS